MAELFSVENLVALLTLTGLEIILGIDNLVFLSILTSKLHQTQQRAARLVGLSLAMGGRVGLLLAISWVMSLTRGLFTLAGREISGRDLILLGGGLFLVAKSTHEIHDKLTPEDDQQLSTKPPTSFGMVVVQRRQIGPLADHRLTLAVIAEPQGLEHRRATDLGQGRR